MAKKVVLSSPFQPLCKEGEQENHYGVPFTAEATDNEDEKGNTILCLTAILPDAEAKVMVEAGRVEVLETIKEEKAAPAAAPGAAGAGAAAK